MAHRKIIIHNHRGIVRDGISTSGESKLKVLISEIERTIHGAIDTPPTLSGQYAKEFNYLKNFVLTAVRGLAP